MPSTDTLNAFSLDFTYAHNKPCEKATFRFTHTDFIVEEDLNTAFSGEGEHYYLQIRKTGENTAFVANELARYLNVKPLVVGYAGLKDRHAVTTQWFSVQLPGQALILDWDDFVAQTGCNAELLTIQKHNKKLRRGEHTQNRFVITLRDITPTPTIENTLQAIATYGVPNYFGVQRFGFEAGNLFAAENWIVNKERIKNRNKKSMLLSAARSYLFNLLLSERVRTGIWRDKIAGDVFDGDTPTGFLWGRGRLNSSDKARELEESIVAPFQHWCEKLEHSGLEQQRRALVLLPQSMSWEWKENQLVIHLALKPGEYATSVLREIAQLKDCSITKPSIA